MGDGYKVIRLRIATIERYKRFSKKMTKSYSETLDVIMDFFEWHGFKPSSRFPQSVVQEVITNRKRSEAIIAIMKNIEKSQTKPTNAMLLSLFEEKLVEEEPKFVERQFVETELKDEAIETISMVQYEQLQNKLNLTKQDFTYMLNKVKLIKNSFSKSYLKLEMTEDELEKFKTRLKNL